MRTFKVPLAGGFLFLFLSAALMQSCQKEDNVMLGEDDAADIVEGTLTGETGGVAGELALLTVFIDHLNASLECGAELSVTKDFEKSTGIRTGNFTYNWEILKICSGESPSINWTGSFDGTFETPRLSGTTSGTRSWLITGIESTDNTLNLNGSINRSGTHNSKVWKQRSFSTEVSTQYDDVVVDKETLQIQSGKGTFQITMNASDGDSASFTGTITFTGNGSATLVINKETFEINIY